MKLDSAVLAGILLLGALEGRGQDLFERNKQGLDSPSVQGRAGQDELHARVAPDFDYRALQKDRGASRTGGGVDFDYDFACGRFDLRSSLKNLLSREFRDELISDLLNAGEGYLAAGALNLLCQSSPTLCNVFKHHRASANLLLALDYDKCRAIEQVLQNDTQRARLIKECLERTLRENPNVPIDEAYQACLTSDEIRNFTGEFVKEINLVEDLSKYFKIEGERKSDLEQIFGKARVSSKGVSEQASLVDAVGGRYNAAKRGYLEAWSRALQDIGAGREPAGELYDRLAPGEARLGPEDIRQINLLPDWKRAWSGRCPACSRTTKRCAGWPRWSRCCRSLKRAASRECWRRSWRGTARGCAKNASGSRGSSRRRAGSRRRSWPAGARSKRTSRRC